MLMLQSVKRLFVGAVSVAVLFGVLFCGQGFAASTYNSGPYGRCAYQYCQDSDTGGTLPSGLEVSINLVNHQVIPSDGYEIIVTPINGRGTSFDHVDFYVDGNLVHTQTPEETGTAKWYWDPGQNGPVTMKIIVTDKDGQTITKEFRLTVSNKNNNNGSAGSGSTRSDNNQSAGNSSDQSSGRGNILERSFDAVTSSVRASFRQLINGGTDVIKALPRPIVYGFPYLLFILLGINALLLFFQARRELQEYMTMQTVLARARALEEDKKAFVGLVSHYLRTPLSILEGGIDLLKQGPVVAPAVSTMDNITKQLSRKIEGLIARIYDEDLTQAQQVVGGVNVPRNLRMWRQPSLYAPALLLGFLAFVFTYLTIHAGGYSISQVNVAAQVIIFSMLVLAMYQILRRLQLRRRDATRARQLVGEETRIASQRNETVLRAADELNNDISTLELASGQITGGSVEFVHEGVRRYHEIMAKFTTAAMLRGAQANQPPERVQFSVLLEHAQQTVGTKAKRKNIVFAAISDAIFGAQSPELLSFVVGTLLDNAVAYGVPNRPVEVSVVADPAQVTITIVNQGETIPENKLSVLFQPFSKVEKIETFNHEGAGLSLYLDKLIMQYLGGGISLQSSAGKTTATLTLPNHPLGNAYEEHLGAVGMPRSGGQHVPATA